MSSYIYTFDSVFWISIATLTFSFCGVVIKGMLQSKCDNTNICWGMITIHRRVELENNVLGTEETKNNV